MARHALAPAIIGAGPAGLTAALRLVDHGVLPTMFEATSNVGGLARTPHRGDWRVDPGGHRFFTANEEISDLWKSLLPPDQWQSVPRRSAMLVDGHLVRYPLVGRDLMTQMGFRRGAAGLSSWLWSRYRNAMRLRDSPSNFDEWGTHEFGRYWYDMFFDGYVRKTWLAEPSDIASDWANQRIKPISWGRKNQEAFTADDVFRYPVRGPGQLWEAAAQRLAESNVVPHFNAIVSTLRFDGRQWSVEQHNGQEYAADAVFSSMPLGSLVEALRPAPPKHILAVARELRHRSLITVAVALGKNYDLPYNWVYTPGGDLHVGRIQNYRNWSTGLAPQGFEGTFLGLEYFTLPEHDLWVAGDDNLGDVVEHDLRRLGFDIDTVEHLSIVRSKYAYPICDPLRDRSVARIRDHLRRNYPSLHPIGRNGMHRYDNQDHAMLSAMHSVDRYFGSDADPWLVNTGRIYHERGLLKS